MKTPPPRKKVLYVITKATSGGAQKYVFDLATNLPKDNFEPIVAYGAHGKLAEDLVASGIKLYRLPSLDRNFAVISDIKSFFELLNCFRKTGPDVIHLNSSKAAALGAVAARLSGIQNIIFTVHGWPFKEDRSVLARAAIYLISWFTALLSHVVIVVSRTDLERGKRMWVVAGKVHYIGIGIEPPAFLSREKAASELSITTTGPRIVTIAELTANKGIRYAIEAMAELKKRGVDVSYFTIGEGEERHTLETLARDNDVSDRVHFLGFVPDAATYLKAFDIFLLPSIKEGMPYVLLEAACARLPIITTEAVEAEHGVRVHIGDTGALADAIVEIQNKEVGFASRVTLEDMVSHTIKFYLPARSLPVREHTQTGTQPD